MRRRPCKKVEYTQMPTVATESTPPNCFFERPSPPCGIVPIAKRGKHSSSANMKPPLSARSRLTIGIGAMLIVRHRVRTLPPHLDLTAAAGGLAGNGSGGGRHTKQAMGSSRPEHLPAQPIGANRKKLLCLRFHFLLWSALLLPFRPAAPRLFSGHFYIEADQEGDHM